MPSYLLLQMTTEIISKVLFIALVIIVPIFLIVVSAIYILRMDKLKKFEQSQISQMEEEMKVLPPLSADNFTRLDLIFANENFEKQNLAWRDLREDSQRIYGDRWLLNPQDYLNEGRIENERTLNLLSFRPAVLIFSIALLSAVLVYTYFSSNEAYNKAWALIPLAAGLTSTLFVYNAILELRYFMQNKYQRIYSAISKTVPVYDSHQGLSLLIDEMLKHESALDNSINEFKLSASKMANSDFSEGICKSVRSIMSQEVTPPIARAGRVLSDLAVNLDQRQMSGMENLSHEFSNQLAVNLAQHLQPLHTELSSLNQLVQDTRAYITSSVNVLNINREHNIQLNKEISESLRLMTLAKNDLANEMSDLSQHVSVMSETGSAMSRAFSGEEDNLAEKIKDLSLSLDHALEVFSQGLKGSSESIEMAGKLKLEQEKQYENVSTQLSRLITNIEELDRSIRNSGNKFTQKSDLYVNETLKAFDEGLAEVVERLIFTTSALREAVESLPRTLENRARKD